MDNMLPCGNPFSLKKRKGLSTPKEKKFGGLVTSKKEVSAARW
jgi:hypothetical protein